MDAEKDGGRERVTRITIPVLSAYTCCMRIPAVYVGENNYRGRHSGAVVRVTI